MVEIGDRPILMHIMERYAAYGHNEFLVAAGYLGHMIKRYFSDFATLSGDIDVDLAKGRVDRGAAALDWRVIVADTGKNTQTGGRLRRLLPRLRDDTIFVTYGDGVADIDFDALLAFHRAHGKLATVTAVHPPARFGELTIDGDVVTAFAEKPLVSTSWINGGFMALEKRALLKLSRDEDLLEHDLLPHLASAGELRAYRHEGFWHPMDTLRDVRTLQQLCSSGAPPWQKQKQKQA